MEPVRVSLFHRFQIWRGDRPVNLGMRKAQELLCLLILYHSKAHTREALADQLWGETPAAQSRRNLRKSLWYLQNALKDTYTVLTIEEGWVRLSDQADVWVDAIAFEESYESVRGLPGAALDAARVRSICAAVELYTGELLEGWYQEWCIYERQRFQFMYLAMLDKLAIHAEAHQQYETGIGYASRILRYDNTREHTHQQLMRLYYLVGARHAALQQYEICVTILRRELDAAPEESTTALYHQIRAGRLPYPGQGLTPPAPDYPIQLAALLDHLESLQAWLGDMQRQVQEKIRLLSQESHTQA